MLQSHLYRPSWILIFGLVLLSAFFAKPLFDLVRLAGASDLYSHIPLIPIVALYLVWLKRNTIAPSPLTASSRLPALVPALGGVLSLIGWWSASAAWRSDSANSLFLLILAYVCFVWALVAGLFGWPTVRRLLFPVAFLIFIVPFPSAVTHAIEFFFQHSSAEAASLMFGLSGTPVLRDGLFFKLPGITIEVAQECSGIRSTLVLFITSLVGAYVFFQVKTHRALLALAVIPIAIVRNGFRIFTIAMLCVHISPDMIHSWIHRRGGPIFFVLSLIPFFALLLFLYARERRSRTADRATARAEATPVQL